MKKQISAIVVKIVFFLILVSFMQIQAVAAESTIYIRADGSVETDTDLLEVNGTTYTLKGDISGLIIVQRSGITINGDGFTISQGGITLAGPDLSHRDCKYVLVKNLRLFNSSIYTVGASNNSFIGNDFNRGGIQVQGCANITGNLIKYNTFRNYTILVDYNPCGLDVITENNFFDSQIAVGLANAPIVEKNYWNDYNGTDTNGDGIGDTPYISHLLNQPIQDDYPLMAPLYIEVIPEFPSLIILPFFIILAVIVIVFKKSLAASLRL